MDSFFICSISMTRTLNKGNFHQNSFSYVCFYFQFGMKEESFVFEQKMHISYVFIFCLAKFKTGCKMSWMLHQHLLVFNSVLIGTRYLQIIFGSKVATLFKYTRDCFKSKRFKIDLGIDFNARIP